MTTKHWAIRKAAVSDADALAECMRKAYRVYTPRLGGEILPPMTVDYAKEIRSHPVWVAEYDEILIGGLILIPEHEYLTIANIAVQPQFQGSGLGRSLLEIGEAEAKRKGYSEMRLATHPLLFENLSLYAHLGWSEFGRDEHRVYMRKYVM
jgi:N-acetylglutamate synthase-like GNAT family acetyltransferase